MSVTATIQRASAGVLRLLGRQLDVIALLLLMAALCNFGLILSDLPISRDRLNTLDESWEIDLAYKASQGIWSGRDFSFTYGPLWQFLASLLPRAPGLTMGSVFKLHYLFSHWSAYIFLFLVARLLMAVVEPWKRAFFLVALAVFWLPADARVGMAVFCFSCYVRLAERLPDGWQGMMVRCGATGALPVVAFLMAGDAGALASVGLAVVLASAFVLSSSAEERRRVIVFALGTAGAGMGWVLLVNSWAAGPLRFDYWTRALDVVSAYRWLMASALTPEAAWRLFYTFLVCACVFAAAWYLREPHSERITMRPLFLLAGALFSLAALQKGMVRSGWGQISQSVLPAFVTTGVILTGYRSHSRRWLTHAALPIAVVLTVMFSGPTGLVSWPGIYSRMMWSPPPFPSCPPGTYYLDQACLLRSEFAMLGPPASFIRAHSAPNDSIAVYPYQNLFGILSGRRVSAGVLQNYAIGGERMTNTQVSTWERERPLLGVYCSDDIVSWPVDGISNFQRTAPVWMYLQRHYVFAAEPAAGVTILRRDDARAKSLQVSAQPLWSAGPGAAAVSSVDIPASSWTRAHTDFLRIKLRVDFPLFWKFAKPHAIIGTLRFADGSTKSTRLAVEPDRYTEIYIYPWEELDLRNFFLPNPDRWRKPLAEGSAVVSFHLHAQPFDQLSVPPRSIRILAIDAIGLGLRRTPTGL